MLAGQSKTRESFMYIYPRELQMVLRPLRVTVFFSFVLQGFRCSRILFDEKFEPTLYCELVYARERERVFFAFALSAPGIPFE